ncbi:DNA-binding protein HEXBP-like protein [Drosera capensis]
MSMEGGRGGGGGGGGERVFRGSDRTRDLFAPYSKDRRSLRQNYLCKNCKRPGHFARGCPNDSVCNNCREVGHMATDCKSKTMCWNCKEPGHLSTECNRQPICHSCGKMGHLARECSKSSDHRTCSNYFQPGYVAEDCINKKTCNKCRKSWHIGRDCLNESICNICFLSGHMSRQCPSVAPSPPIMAPPPRPPLPLPTFGRPYPDMVCRNCGRPGHFSHECAYNIRCCICGGRGHRAVGCPSVPMLQPGYRSANQNSDAPSDHIAECLDCLRRLATVGSGAIQIESYLQPSI